MTARMPPVIAGLLAVAAAYPLCGSAGGFAQPPGEVRELKVRQTEDFAVTGDGSAAAWQQAAWAPLHARAVAGQPYESRFKVLYSKTGLYVLMDAADRKITATMTEDFQNLWTEDVFEVFLWPEDRKSTRLNSSHLGISYA